MGKSQPNSLEQNQTAQIEPGLKQSIFVCLLLTTVTLAVYWPVEGFDFINYDDHDYVSENHHVLAGLTKQSIHWAFVSGHTANWHPLTWLSHMLDVQLFGRNAGGPHLINLFFHTANTLLLFLLFRQLTAALWRSAFVAALFALHPLHVESVAWISERKDVLSTFFGLITLLFYASFAQRRLSVPNFRPFTSGQYWLAILFFTLSLMSKPMVVTLPFVMVLLDYWPLQRATTIRTVRTLVPLFREKLPFFFLSAASCIVTFLVQREGGAVQSLSGFPLTVRIQNALVSYARYLGKTFWPVDLANPYPHPGQWPLGWVIFATLLVIGLCVAAIWLGRQQRYLLTGWFWFLGMLIPVIGLVQVGFQSLADRYTYMPLIGMFVVIVWGVSEAFAQIRVPRLIIGAMALLVLGVCTARTANQVRLWQNSRTLSSHAIAVTKNNSIAYQNLGNYFLENGEVDKAIDNFQNTLQTLSAITISHVDLISVLTGKNTEDEAPEKLRRALAANPGQLVTCAEILNSLGTALARNGREDEAIDHYRAALRLVPNHAMALHNLGFELSTRKNYVQAIEYLEAAVRLKPDQPDMRESLGDVLMQAGRTDEAIQQFREGLQLAPNHAKLLNSLGLALAAQGNAVEAIEHYKAALRADAKLIEVHNNLGSAFITIGNLDEAIQHFRLLLQWMPAHCRAQDNLGIALAIKGDLDGAVAQLLEAVRCNPEYANTHFNLGNVMAMQRRFDEATRQYEETLRLSPNHAQAHCHLAGVLAETGHRSEAITHLNEALKLKPDYTEAKQQLQALDVKPE